MADYWFDRWFNETTALQKEVQRLWAIIEQEVEAPQNRDEIVVRKILAEDGPPDDSAWGMGQQKPACTCEAPLVTSTDTYPSDVGCPVHGDMSEDAPQNRGYEAEPRPRTQTK